MTAQDVLPGLDQDEDERRSESATPRRGRWLLAGTLATVTALAGVVVVVHSLAATTPPTWTAATSTAPVPPPVTADTAVTPQPGPVLIKAALDYPGLIDNVVPTAPLVVGTEPVQGGVVPDRLANFDSCHADPASLQYVPIQVRMPESWLSATVTVRTTASTPVGIGRLGFFFQAGPASTPCPKGAWSTSDSFLANGGQSVVTGYIVLDRAFTPWTPQGRADVFGTLGLRVSHIRLSLRPAAVSPPSVGSLCPGTRDELCASLG